MTGYIVPGDWDGSTWQKYVVDWPDSAEWNALLTGQLTTFAFLDVWDSSTGDSAAAASVGGEIIDRNNQTGHLPPEMRPGGRMIDNGVVELSSEVQKPAASSVWETLIETEPLAYGGNLMVVSAEVTGHHVTTPNAVNWSARILVSNPPPGQEDDIRIGNIFRAPGTEDISKVVGAAVIALGGATQVALQVFISQPEVRFGDNINRPTRIVWRIFEPPES